MLKADRKIHYGLKENIEPDNKRFSANTWWHLVRNCMYNCGLIFSEGSGFSLDDIPKKTVKHVVLYRSHSF